MTDRPGPDLIRRLRAEANLSQHQLAVAVGVTAPAISQIENAKITPRRDTVARIGHALGARAELLVAFGYPVSLPADDDVLRRVETLERLVLGLAARLRESLEGDEELLRLVDGLQSERAARRQATR